MQESFLRAWEQMERYEPERPFLPWLYTIARHLAASRGRADARRPASHLDQDPPSGELDPSEVGSRAETADNLWHLASRVLGEEQRSALWLRYVDGLEPSEIAQVLERRPTAVRVLLFRARRTLARHLPANGHTANGHAVNGRATNGHDPTDLPGEAPAASPFSTAPWTGGA